MRTAVIILNWNTAGYLESFLPSLLESLEGEDAELVSESKELFDRMIKLRNKIVSKYSDIFLGECQNFYNDYKNLFDPGFEKRVKEMTGNEGLESHITL